MEINLLLYYSLILISSFLTINIYQRLFLKNKIHDEINDRSSHVVMATRSGGVSIFSVVFLISSYNYIIQNEIFDFSLIIPLFLLMVVGLYDDIYKLDFKLKFIFQIIAAKIIIDNGLIINNLHGVFGVFEINRIIAQILTIFIIVSIINAINFIDGIDGLANSIVVLFLIAIEFFSSNQSPFFNLTTITILSIIPLFYYNFRKKKKVFLGDSGSLFLGGLVSIYVVYSLTNSYVIKPEFDIHKILFILSIMIYPIVDLIRVFVIRILNNQSPFIADKKHIHHIILKYTKSHWRSTSLIVLTSILNLIFIQLIF